MEEVRIVMLGHTGAGKSSTGNTILGRKVFDSATAAISQTCRVTKRSKTVNGKTITLADTPGFCDTRDIDVESKIQDFVSDFKPHVFLFVITLSNRFPQEVATTLDRIAAIFGPKVYRHGIVLFTSTDYLQDLSLHAFVDDYAHPKVKDLVKKCNRRYVGFDNSYADARVKSRQVQELMKQIDQIDTSSSYGRSARSTSDTGAIVNTEHTSMNGLNGRNIEEAISQIEVDLKKIDNKINKHGKCSRILESMAVVFLSLLFWVPMLFACSFYFATFYCNMTLDHNQVSSSVQTGSALQSILCKVMHSDDDVGNLTVLDAKVVALDSKISKIVDRLDDVDIFSLDKFKVLDENVSALDVKISMIIDVLDTDRFSSDKFKVLDEKVSALDVKISTTIDVLDTARFSSDKFKVLDEKVSALDVKISTIIDVLDTDRFRLDDFKVLDKKVSALDVKIGKIISVLNASSVNSSALSTNGNNSNITDIDADKNKLYVNQNSCKERKFITQSGTSALAARTKARVCYLDELFCHGVPTATKTNTNTQNQDQEINLGQDQHSIPNWLLIL